MTKTPHEWQPSTYGHGNQVCKHCLATDLEIGVIGDMDHCPDAAKKLNGSTSKSLLPCPFCGGKASFKPQPFKVSCDSCGAYVPNGAVSVSIHRSGWNTRADLAPDPLRAVKVRALVFTEARNSMWDGQHGYRIGWNKDDEFRVKFGERTVLKTIKGFSRAVQWANDHHAARIRSALEPDPQDARVAALVDALKQIKMAKFEDGTWQCVAKRQAGIARAALSAFGKGGKDE